MPPVNIIVAVGDVPVAELIVMPSFAVSVELLAVFTLAAPENVTRPLAVRLESRSTVLADEKVMAFQLMPLVSKLIVPAPAV